MGFFSDLFYKDPSREWPVHQRMEWDLRYESGILNNAVRFESPASELKAFGRPSNSKPHKRHCFEYHPSGLAVEMESGKVVGYDFYFGDELYPLFQEASLSLSSSKGPKVRLTTRTQPDDIIEVLGEPQEREVDDGDAILIYETRRWTITADFRKARGLVHFSQMYDGEL